MRLNNEQIILIDPDILQEYHLPQEINARTDHIKEIEECLRPITEGRKIDKEEEKARSDDSQKSWCR
jgi:hypothetical protein